MLPQFPSIDRRRLFLDTLQDIRERLSTHDEYKTLGLAWLLRKLLLDEAPLLDLVNRDFRIPVRYSILRPGGPPAGLPAPDFWAVGVALDPASGFPHGEPQSLTRAQFLATPIIYTKSVKINIRDFVSYQSHVAGAVHVQEPMHEKDKELVAFEYAFQEAFDKLGTRRVDITGQQLRAIASVVIAAMTELQSSVTKQIAGSK